jgi:hypothetical protein
MNENRTEARGLAGGRPRLSKISNWFTAAMKNERTVRALRRLRALNDFEQRA